MKRKLQFLKTLLLAVGMCAGASDAWGKETRTSVYSNNFSTSSDWTAKGKTDGWTCNPGTTTANTFSSQVIGVGAGTGDMALVSPSFSIDSEVTLVDVEMKFKFDGCTSGKSSGIEFITSDVNINNGYVSAGTPFFAIGASASGNGYWGSITCGGNDYTSTLNNAAGTFENNSLNRNTTGIVVLNVRFNFTTKTATYTLSNTSGTTLVASTTVAFANTSATTLDRICIHAGKTYGGVTIDDVNIYSVTSDEVVTTYRANFTEENSVAPTVTIYSDADRTVEVANGLLEDGTTYYYRAVKAGYKNYEGSFTVSGSDVDVNFTMIAEPRYTINAVSGGTTILTIASGYASPSTVYSTSVPKVISYGGNYYVLDDESNANLSDYQASYTMGDADVTKEINYTLDETILYYAEAENMTTSKTPTVSSGSAATCSKGQAWCSFAAEGSYFKSELGLSYPIYADIEAGVYGRKATTATLQLISSADATTNLGTQAVNLDEYKTWSANKTLIPAGSEFYIANDNGSNPSMWALDYVIIRRSTFTVADEANVVGAKNFSTNASGAYSADYAMKKGDTKVITFKNHGTTFENNYRITVKEGETWKSNTRADFFDETGSYHLDFDLTDGADDWKVMSTDGGSTKVDLNWDNFASDMADATVVATLVYGVDGKLTIDAVATGTTPGNKYFVHNEISGLTSDLTINLSVCHSWLEVLSVEHSISATIPSSTYGTIASAYALDCANLPGGVTAYKVSSLSASSVTLVPVTEAVAPGTGLILSGTAGTYSIPVVASGTDISATNLLKAAVTAYDCTANEVYILKGGEFHLVNAASTVPAGKAYLLAGDVTAPSLNFVFGGETTGINSVEAGEVLNGAFYNLNGQRVAAPGKGLYIVNGKKVIIK